MEDWLAELSTLDDSLSLADPLGETLESSSEDSLGESLSELSWLGELLSADTSLCEGLSDSSEEGLLLSPMEDSSLILLEELSSQQM